MNFAAKNKTNKRTNEYAINTLKIQYFPPLNLTIPHLNREKKKLPIVSSVILFPFSFLNA